MNTLISKVIAEIGRTLGKAIIAGVGMEIAKVAGTHLQKRLAAKPGGKDGKDPAKDADKEPKDAAPRDPEEVRAENERLRAENERLREELASTRKD